MPHPFERSPLVHKDYRHIYLFLCKKGKKIVASQSLRQTPFSWGKKPQLKQMQPKGRVHVFFYHCTCHRWIPCHICKCMNQCRPRNCRDHNRFLCNHQLLQCGMWTNSNKTFFSQSEIHHSLNLKFMWIFSFSYKPSSILILNPEAVRDASEENFIAILFDV